MKTNVFFGGLPRDFTKNDLCKLVEPFGETKTVKIMINLKTGESLCYGFVDFCEPSAAQSAIENLDMKAMGTKCLHLKYAVSKEQYGTRSKTIFAKSLPLFYSIEEIYNMFSKPGKLVCFRPEQQIFPEKQIRGYYFLYETEEDAFNAIKAYDNTIVVENGWPLYIRFSDEDISKDPDVIYPEQIKDKKYQHHRAFFQPYTKQTQALDKKRVDKTDFSIQRSPNHQFNKRNNFKKQYPFSQKQPMQSDKKNFYKKKEYPQYNFPKPEILVEKRMPFLYDMTPQTIQKEEIHVEMPYKRHPIIEKPYDNQTKRESNETKESYTESYYSFPTIEENEEDSLSRWSLLINE